LRVVEAAFAVVLFVSTAASAEEPRGTLRGLLDTPGRQGLVAFFDEAAGPPPRPERYFRVPDFTVASDREGRFTASLPPGRYFVAAIVRKGGDPIRLGPPLEGDRDYQLVGQDDTLTIVTVTPGATHDLGTLTHSFLYGRPLVEGATLIEGRVIGPDGNPVAGVHVVAYRAPRFNGRPHFSSYVTGADGRYELRVHPGGAFFLRARSRWEGGAPEVGEKIGVLGGAAPETVRVQTGHTSSGRDIRVLPFAGRGPSTDRKGATP